jgi:hypothetical protein
MNKTSLKKKGVSSTMKKTKHKKTTRARKTTHRYKLSKSVRVLFAFEAVAILASIVVLTIVALEPNGSVDIPNDVSYVKEDQ